MVYMYFRVSNSVCKWQHFSSQYSFVVKECNKMFNTNNSSIDRLNKFIIPCNAQVGFH